METTQILCGRNQPFTEESQPLVETTQINFGKKPTIDGKNNHAWGKAIIRGRKPTICGNNSNQLCGRNQPSVEQNQTTFGTPAQTCPDVPCRANTQRRLQRHLQRRSLAPLTASPKASCVRPGRRSRSKNPKDRTTRLRVRSVPLSHLDEHIQVLLSLRGRHLSEKVRQMSDDTQTDLARTGRGRERAIRRSRKARPNSTKMCHSCRRKLTTCTLQSRIF